MSTSSKCFQRWSSLNEYDCECFFCLFFLIVYSFIHSTSISASCCTRMRFAGTFIAAFIGRRQAAASLSLGHIQRQNKDKRPFTHHTSRQFLFTKSPHVHVSGLWNGARVPREEPTQGEHPNITQAQALNSQPRCCEKRCATRCSLSSKATEWWWFRG